ncbi:MAG TPA: hypothetical protein VNQ79_05675 [Blastocatellia bacterium]|nr:hypothetical protein [Blastocatellia bacterium]
MARVIAGFGLFLVLAVILVITLLALMIFRLVRSRARSRGVPDLSDFDSLRTPDSGFAICQRCGEQRIIVSRREGLCASCYSSMRTKTLA